MRVCECACGFGPQPHPPARCPVSDRSVRGCLSVAPSAAAEWLQATRRPSSRPSHQPHHWSLVWTASAPRLPTGACERACCSQRSHILLSSIKFMAAWKPGSSLCWRDVSMPCMTSQRVVLQNWVLRQTLWIKDTEAFILTGVCLLIWKPQIRPEPSFPVSVIPTNEEWRLGVSALLLSSLPPCSWHQGTTSTWTSTCSTQWPLSSAASRSSAPRYDSLKQSYCLLTHCCTDWDRLCLLNAC